jgi:hypothetical protein
MRTVGAAPGSGSGMAKNEPLKRQQYQAVAKLVVLVVYVATLRAYHVDYKQNLRPNYRRKNRWDAVLYAQLVLNLAAAVSMGVFLASPTGCHDRTRPLVQLQLLSAIASLLVLAYHMRAYASFQASSASEIDGYLVYFYSLLLQLLPVYYVLYDDGGVYVHIVRQMLGRLQAMLRSRKIDNPSAEKPLVYEKDPALPVAGF